MRKVLAAALFSVLGLAGCVAVPVYDAPVAYGPPAVYVAPPAVVIHGHYDRGWHGRHWR